MGVDDHHCAASFSLFQSIGVPVEVSHNNIRVDLVFNQKLDSAISGYLVIALSVASLDRLIREVERWEQRQGNE